jgi:hypothetical protein
VTYVDADALYSLLPAYIRVRDQTQGGGVLQALVGVIAGQAQVVSDSLDQQYDDQFIETCESWVVPYIGELIGFTPLQPLGPGQPSATRAEVADTIGYRRRKGTLDMLEQLCSDVTGWPGIAVEYFSRLSTTQYVRNHLRLDNTMVDVHSPMTAVDIGSAFDLPPRTVDVRRIDTGRGRYNICNIGIFVWRLQPYVVENGPARMLAGNQYTFDPFGGDVPLVNPAPATAAPFTLLSQTDVPFFLQYYPLYAGVQPYASGAPGSAAPPAGQAALPVGVSVNGTAIETEAIEWCDLSTWTVPTAPGVNVAVDPELGRLVFADAPTTDDDVTLDYAYAFSGDYGGGHYDYSVADDEALLEVALPTAVVPAFATANLSTYSNELVEIADSGLYVGDQALAPNAQLLVVTAADQQRPVMTGDLVITSVAGASVTLRGLGIGGSLTVKGVGPFTLALKHCSVRGGIDWSSTAVSGILALDHTLSAAIEANPDVEVTVGDSAVDAGSDTAAAVSAGAGAAAGSVTITTSTVVGTVNARAIPILSDSIVTGTVVSTERQAGCLRYSFTPLTGSQTPRRFRCQPDLEIASEVATALDANPGLTSAQQTAIQELVESWLSPVFTSRTPGQPGYLQLADTAPGQIRFGAEEEDEMGVYYGLFSGRRESNLTYRINEYLRVGLAAGIIHAT